ncbi:MAG: hypothetical protein PVH62_10340 [Anaerolineae bacterium]|jgi:hypothetical protein
MKINEVLGMAAIALFVGIVAAVVVALLCLPPGVIRTLALILVGGVTLALITAASAFPIRAYKSSGPHERERIIERHTIKDGRREPRIITLPAGRSSAWEQWLFPGLARAALRGDQPLEALHDGQDQAVEVIEGEAEEVLPSDDWRGLIRG